MPDRGVTQDCRIRRCRLITVDEIDVILDSSFIQGMMPVSGMAGHIRHVRLVVVFWAAKPGHTVVVVFFVGGVWDWEEISPREIDGPIRARPAACQNIRDPRHAGLGNMEGSREGVAVRMVGPNLDGG